MSIQKLENLLDSKWQMILQSNSLIKIIQNGCSDRILYALYLVQTYYYTSHNAKNQAIVALQISGKSSREINYSKFCFNHALEETGHELMALHDLRKIGLQIPIDRLPPSMPSTETLIAYLYYISKNGNPVRRLGYSFWAESSYKYFGHIMQMAAQNMKLDKSMMTFFSEHSDIDEHHAEEVEKMIHLVCKSDNDFNDVAEVMLQTLELTNQMLNEIAYEYQKILENKSVWNDIINEFGLEMRLNQI